LLLSPAEGKKIKIGMTLSGWQIYIYLGWKVWDRDLPAGLIVLSPFLSLSYPA